MNLHVLQHAGCEGPGAIGDWARARDYSIATTHLYRGEPLPPAEEVEFLVLMGGPMNIYQDRDHPWLPGERAFIAAHLAAGKPAIGICLGSQFLADALGGRVHQNAHIEIGWFPVEFTEEARARFSFLPVTQEVLHWHGDTFELPVGALRLAQSAGCRNQGFVFGGNVLALQFHPEISHEAVTALVAECGDELPPATYVQPAEALLASNETKYAAGTHLLHELLDEIYRL